MITNVLEHGVNEVARVQLLAQAEQRRRERDLGRHDGRIRYAPMQCRVLGIAGPDRLHVEVTGPEWDAAGRPSRGVFGADVGPVQVVDAHPHLTSDDRNWLLDVTRPVRLLIGWNHATRVRVAGDGEDFHLKYPAAIELARLIGSGIGSTREPGPIRVEFNGKTFDVSVAPWCSPRPTTPLLSLSADDRRRERAAVSRAAWDANANADIFARLAARGEAEKGFDDREKQERDEVSDWERRAQMGRTPIALDTDLIAARWPGGVIQLTDTY